MTITVVTAVLNAREELVRTRASLLSQRQVDVQHVVVDGGSTDGTLELIAGWTGDPRCRVISEPDSGVYQAFNRGLRLAEGDYIGFLNAGDVYHDENVLSDVLGVFCDSAVDLVFGDVDITPPNSINETTRRYRSASFTRDKLLRGLMPPHPSIYARAQVYREVGEFAEEFRIAGDFEWVLRAWLLKQVNALYVDRTFVRMPSGGISNNGWRSIWENTLEMHRALTSHGLPASWLSLCARLPLKWFAGK